MQNKNGKLIELIIAKIWNDPDYSPALVEELISNDYVGRSPDGTVYGRSGYIKDVAELHTAFPDVQYAIEDMVVEGDRVATRWTASGTHRGHYGSIPPTGKSGQVMGMDFSRIAGGQVIEEWGLLDRLGILQQMGVVPELETS